MFHYCLHEKRKGLLGLYQGTILDCECTKNPTTKVRIDRMQTARRNDNGFLSWEAKNIVGRNGKL